MNPFAYGFMLHAYAASAAVAVMAALCGYFLVLRGQSFAGHALGHVGFAGAAAAMLLGWPALPGLMATAVAGGLAMGLLGEAADARRDVGIGLVLAAALGLGLLFLSLFSGSAATATALLFGNVLGVDTRTLHVLIAVSLVVVAGIGVLFRPLLFASVQRELAEARGVRVRLVAVLFLGLAGLAVAGSAQVTGVLLVFSLMVGPAATAQVLSGSVRRGISCAVGFALAEALGGVTIAFFSDWPVSFCISMLAALGYAGAVLVRAV